MQTTLKDHPSRPDRVIVESSVQAEFERSNEAGIARYRAAVEACSTPAEVRRVSADVLPENRWRSTHGYFAEMTTGPKHRRGTYYLGIAQVNGCGEREAGTRRWALGDPRGKLLQSRAVLEEATLRDLGPLPAPCGLILDRMDHSPAGHARAAPRSHGIFGLIAEPEGGLAAPHVPEERPHVSMGAEPWPQGYTQAQVNLDRGWGLTEDGRIERAGYCD